ncbi:MAG: glycosyl hydrolase, partial [Ignavibacteriae bacterium]|nr:glycosyl hydrolase [Ignavibacteriota bacterium]
GFVESDGCISIEAEHYTKAISNDSITWQIIPNLGRTGSSVIPVPVSLSHNSTTDSDRHLEYEFYSITKGNVNINLYCSPTLNFANLSSGIKYAISIDDENPKIINLTNNQNPPDLNYDPIWNKWVAENINIQTSEHNLTKPGKHVLKIWAIDPGIVLQKIVIDSGGMKPSYLGPPDNYLIKYEN